MDADAGIPVVLAHPDDPSSLAVRELADAVVRRPEGLRGLTVERSGR